MSAETGRKPGVKQKNCDNRKDGKRNLRDDIGNSIRGWQKPSVSVQAKEFQYGE